MNKLETREQAEARARELFPNGEKVMEKYTSTIQRESLPPMLGRDATEQTDLRVLCNT